MKFTAQHNLRLINVRHFTSKNGKELTFLTLADPVTYENVDLMPLLGSDVSSFVTGKDYECILHFDGRFTNVELTPIK